MRRAHEPKAERQHRDDDHEHAREHACAPRRRSRCRASRPATFLVMTLAPASSSADAGTSAAKAPGRGDQAQHPRRVVVLHDEQKRLIHGGALEPGNDQRGGEAGEDHQRQEGLVEREGASHCGAASAPLRAL